MSLTKIYGMLAAHTVELPYETPEAQAEADKTNQSIAGLGRVFRGAMDFAFMRYESTFSHTRWWRRAREKKPLRLESGDLVQVFKTVSDGHVLWRGTVDYSYENYHHGLQKGMKPRKWSDMFADQLPVRLERDGKIIFGALEPFSETGTEGIIWSIHEYGKKGYDGLNVLKKDDKLTVYDKVRGGEVEWAGALAFGPEKVSKIGFLEIMRQSTHMDTQQWLDLSFQSRPAVLTPRNRR